MKILKHGRCRVFNNLLVKEETMGWIVSMIFAVIICGALLWIGKRLLRDEDDEKVTAGKIFKIIALILFPLWVIGLTLGAMIYQVPAGKTGVVYEFGAIKGQISEGLQTVAPWKKAVMANIRVERHVFDKLNSFSQETQDVFVMATLNIRVSPQAIQELYRTVGPNYFEVLVAPRVAQNFKDETVKYKSVDIAPHREDIRKAVRERLERELASYSIEVVDLLLDNIDFNPGFKAAIEAKQIATQRALEEEQKVAVVRHQAEQAVEKAQGEGNAILTLAEKQAEANKKLSASLTPSLIQYSLIQKLADKIQVMLLPAGQNFLLNPSDLMKKTE